MKKLVLGLLIFGLTSQFMFAQILELPEVKVDVNCKYLDAIESADVSEAVLYLEKEVAFYDVKESNLYEVNESSFYKDDYEYTISFNIPEGKIVAAYDKNGTIIRTMERFNNVKLPKSVTIAIMDRFPKWRIVEDVYRVNYFGKSGMAKKSYKVKLKNKDKWMTAKFDENGEFL